MASHVSRLVLLTCLVLVPIGGDAAVLSEAKLVPLDLPHTTDFGSAVAASKKFIAVGAINGLSSGGAGEIYSGAVHVFEKVGGAWTETAHVSHDDPGASGNDQFGAAVDVSGTTMVVGTGTAGSAYVFEYKGGAWSQVAKLTGPTAAGSAFGRSVAIDGGVIVVGDKFADGAVGAAYVFERSGNGRLARWERTATLAGAGGQSGGGPGLSFGDAVDVSKGTIVVGAPGHDESPTQSDAGAAFVFGKQGANWAQQAMLVATDATNFLYLGDGVAISKKTIVAGSRGDFDESGAAYVFERAAGGRGARWVERTKLVGSGAGDGDWAGTAAVAIDRKTIVLGSPLDSDITAFAGTGYIFRRKSGAWQEERVSASDAGIEHRFGEVVAVAGKVVVFASEYGTTSGIPRTGAAYVYE